MGEIGNVYKISLGSLTGRDPLEDLSIDRRLISKLILGKQCGRIWTGFIWHGIQTGGRLL
jgi:hypothetical protein